MGRWKAQSTFYSPRTGSGAVKCVPNRGVDCFVSCGSFLLFLVCVSGVCSVVFVFGCQYQCNEALR